MDNEMKEWKQDENGRTDAMRGSISALVLILIGGGLLARNFLDIPFDNWWVLFLLAPVLVLYYQVWRSFRSNGRFTSRSIGPLIGSLVLSTMIVTFLFNLDWGQLWPVVFIIGGIGALLGKRASE